MKRDLQLTLDTEAATLRREWAEEGVPVLTAELTLPEPVGPLSRAARRIGRYYQAQGRAYLRYCEHWLFPLAAEEFRQAAACGAPLPCWRASLGYRVTYNEAGWWSLYTQSRETDGRRTELLRRGDTWDLASGRLLPLTDFLGGRSLLWRRRLRLLAAEEIRRQEAAGVSRYCADWSARLRKSLSRDNFYLTPEGLCFFFQMYALAPAAEGVPVFLLPFGPDGCVLPARPGAEPPPPPDGAAGISRV